MDLPVGHTKTCLPTSARKGSPVALEDQRLSLIGNGFQCAAVAWLLAHQLQHWGLLNSFPMAEVFPGRLLKESVESLPDEQSELVRSISRSVDHKGSDVRLMTSEALNPSIWPRRPISPHLWVWQQSKAWKWKS
eukprot:287246-Karenia_brevis.AAC.1